jgi:hypothetical protein
MFVSVNGRRVSVSHNFVNHSVLRGGRLIKSASSVGPIANLDGLRASLGKLRPITRKFLKI